MTYERRWRPLVFRWTALKGLAAILLFLVLAFLTEYVVVTFFLSYGMKDQFLLTQIVGIPGTDISLTLSISPLYHLIPLGVISVLVSSWTHLTKFMAIVPRRGKSRARARKEPKSLRKRRQVKRFRSFKRFSRWIGRKRTQMSNALFRVRGISYVMQQLSFATATSRSAITVIMVFLTSMLGLYLLTHPTLVYEAVVGFHQGTPWFHDFVLKTIEMTDGLSLSVNEALSPVALGFHNTFRGLGPIIQPLIKLDLVWKYTLCQNLAAWMSALAAWGYGQYTSRLHHRGRH